MRQMHAGFCLELEFLGDLPKKVCYRKHIASLELIEFYYMSITEDTNGALEIADKILDALLVKLEEWSYEEEYRYFAGNDMGRISPSEVRMSVPFDEHVKVSAVIFGRRMAASVKDFIRKELPYTTEFRQAVERKDFIEIVPFNANEHMNM
jgi:hypothetical protein